MFVKSLPNEFLINIENQTNIYKHKLIMKIFIFFNSSIFCGKQINFTLVEKMKTPIYRLFRCSCFSFISIHTLKLQRGKFMIIEKHDKNILSR